MNLTEIRTSARESLKGNWGKAACIYLIYTIICLIISFLLLLIPIIGYLANILISPILGFGLLSTYFKLSRNKEATYFGFLTDGFEKTGKIIAVFLRVLLKLLLPFLLYFVAIIILSASTITENIILSIICFVAIFFAFAWIVVKSYGLMLAMYILFDESELSSKDIVNKSEALMKGNKLDIFFLQLSFIGWVILAALTFGIGNFWLYPYMEVSQIKFYEKLSGTTNTDPIIEN